MQSVLLSLHPEWWALMLSGDKLLELRKTFPQRIATPFRVIVYLTAPVCAVVGDFVCIGKLHTDDYSVLSGRSMVDAEKVREYAKGGKLYGWCVDGVRTFEEQKELAAFGLRLAPQSWCYVEG